jgi:hypothetical protein
MDLFLLFPFLDLISLLREESAILALIDRLIRMYVNSKYALSINSKLLDPHLYLTVNVSGHTVVDLLYIVKFLLKSLQKLSVFKVRQNSFVSVLQKVGAFIDPVAASCTD